MKKIFERISELSSSVDKYKKDSVVQSLPSVASVNRAKKMMTQKKYEEAEKVLLEALSLPQKDPLVYKYLGAVYERLGKHELSVENYQLSADLNPNDKIIWQRLGFALMSCQKYEQAEKSFENADKIFPANTDNFAGWGMALMKQKKYSQAREKFLKAIEFDKYNFSAVFLCSVMEIRLEMYDKAENKLIFLANVCPNESNAFEYARLKALKDDYDSAILYAKKSLDYNPKMLPAYILLGQIYAFKYDEENSLKSFETAFEKGLLNANLLLEWGKALQKFGRYDEAKQKFLNALELENDNMEILANLGLCCVLRKEFEQATPILSQVLEKEPQNSVVKQALGIINYEKNDIDTAISYLRNNDESPVNCYYLAKCYEKLNNDTKIRDFYEAAIRLNPSYTQAFVDYSQYLISKKEFSQAQRKLRKAVKFVENNSVLLNLLFYTSYILVKENLCEYNVKETIAIVEKFNNPDLFEYPEQKAELNQLLQDMKEK